MKPQITIYLDKRRAKKDGRYPVKLRVWDATTKKAKIYPTGLDLNENDFDKAWNTKKPPKVLQELRVTLNGILSKAEKVADKLDPFTFEMFEKRLYRKSGDAQKVMYHYGAYMKYLLDQDRIGSADSYRHSKDAITDYLNHRGYLEPANLFFQDITPTWLEGFEKYMIETKGRSITTVGIYLRNLRAIFNKAIREGELEEAYYPFGKGKYQIPSSGKVKKALSIEQLKVLFESKPKTPEQQKAKDFWFFSYSLNGINAKDIAQLRYKQIEGDSVTFYRAKTIHTSKANLKPISGYLTNYVKKVISTYGNSDKAPNNLVFDIISDQFTAEENHFRVKNFVRFINQHIKKLCEELGLPGNISYYWARHSYATNAVRQGASMEFIQESLGHTDTKTTQSYFAGFEEKAKKEIANKLMDFS